MQAIAGCTWQTSHTWLSTGPWRLRLRPRAAPVTRPMTLRTPARAEWDEYCHCCLIAPSMEPSVGAFFVQPGDCCAGRRSATKPTPCFCYSCCVSAGPGLIVLVFVVATVANHALAGALGQLVSNFSAITSLYTLLAISFIAVAGWTLIPDKLDEDETPAIRPLRCLFRNAVAFLLRRDGRQDADPLYRSTGGFKFDAYVWVGVGHTLGMMLGQCPVRSLWATPLATKLPLTLSGRIASALPVDGLFTLPGWAFRAFQGEDSGLLRKYYDLKIFKILLKNSLLSI